MRHCVARHCVMRHCVTRHSVIASLKMFALQKSKAQFIMNKKKQQYDQGEKVTNLHNELFAPQCRAYATFFV